ncbi:MAG: peptidyl-prolyl cis-trans isomerase [Crocosphaera sp.]
MNSSVITINDQIVPWEQVMGHLQLFGKLQPFLQEFVSQYVLVEEINSRKDLEIPSADVMQAMMDFRLQQDLTDANKFKEWLQKENLDNQTFQNRIVLGLKVEKLKEVIAAPQLDSYFLQHQGSFEEVLLHCVITPEQELSQEVQQRLTTEKITVEDLAKDYSNSEKNVRFFKQQVQRRALGKDVRDALATAVKDDVLGPISVNNNWSLFKVVDVIPSQFDDKIQKQIEAQLFGEWLVEKLRHLKMEFKSVTDGSTKDPLTVA